MGGRACVCPVMGCAVGKRRAGRPPSFDGGVREGPDHVNESRHEVGNKRARGMFVLPAQATGSRRNVRWGFVSQDKATALLAFGFQTLQEKCWANGAHPGISGRGLARQNPSIAGKAGAQE